MSDLLTAYENEPWVKVAGGPCDGDEVQVTGQPQRVRMPVRAAVRTRFAARVAIYELEQNVMKGCVEYRFKGME